MAIAVCMRCGSERRIYRHKPIRRLIWGVWRDVSRRLCAVCVIRLGKVNPNYDAACAEELVPVLKAHGFAYASQES